MLEQKQKHDELLVEIIQNCDWYHTLKDIRAEQLPDWWVAGGAVRNTVWKHLYKEDCHLGVKDLDVVYFDSNTNREVELAAKASLSSKHPDWPFDVKNQASFGIWRDWPWSFTSSADGIKHFLHTANAVGIRLTADDRIEICQPYGLQDLFSGILRRTPIRQDSEVALKKQEEYMRNCSRLKAQ